MQSASDSPLIEPEQAISNFTGTKLNGGVPQPQEGQIRGNNEIDIDLIGAGPHPHEGQMI